MRPLSGGRGKLGKFEVLDQRRGACGHGDARGVAEVAAGGSDVEPVILGEFGGDEAGHGRFAAEREYPPNGFAEGANRGRSAERKAAGDRRSTERDEELVDPVPEDDGLTVGDEKGAASCGRIVTY